MVLGLEDAVVTEEKNEKGQREFVHRFLTDRLKEKLRVQAKEKGQELVEMGREIRSRPKYISAVI